MHDLTPLLTTKQAAKILGISERKIWSMTNSGELPCVRIGRAVRYDISDLKKWIQKRKRKSTGAITAETVLHGADPEPGKVPRRGKRRA